MRITLNKDTDMSDMNYKLKCAKIDLNIAKDQLVKATRLNILAESKVGTSKNPTLEQLRWLSYTVDQKQDMTKRLELAINKLADLQLAVQ